MTSSLLRSVPPCLHGTAQGPARRRRRRRRRLRTHRHPCTSEERAGRGRGPGGRPRSPGQASPAPRPGPGHPPSCRRPQQVCGGPPASLTTISCLTRSRPHEGRVPSTARRSKRPATSAHRHCAGDRDHRTPGSHNVRFGTAPGSRLGHQVADHIRRFTFRLRRRSVVPGGSGSSVCSPGCRGRWLSVTAAVAENSFEAGY